MLLNDNCSGPWEGVLNPAKELSTPTIQSGVGVGVGLQSGMIPAHLGAGGIGGQGQEAPKMPKLREQECALAGGWLVTIGLWKCPGATRIHALTLALEAIASLGRDWGGGEWHTHAWS